MNTRATRAAEMTSRPFFGRPAKAKIVHNLTGIASASTVVTPRNPRVLPGFVAAMPLRRPTKAVVIGMLLATLLFARLGFAQVIQNPSFEQVQIGPLHDTTGYLSKDPKDVPGWTHSGDVGDALLWNIAYPDTGVAGAGKQFVTLGGGAGATGTATWQTKIVGLSPGQTYRVGFKIADEGQAVSQTMTAWVSFSNLFPIPNRPPYTATCGSSHWQCWEQKYLLFFVPSGFTTAILSFSVSGQMYDIGLDDITIKKAPQTGGTWTPTLPFPGLGAGLSLLLTDGRVLVYADTSCLTQADAGDWYTLTPDQFGDYVKGTWTKVASLNTILHPMFPYFVPYCYAPHGFASAVLPDGRVLVEGGEFNNSFCVAQPNNTNQGAIYDPVAASGFGVWSSVDPPPGWATIGDAQSAVLPNGTFILANKKTSQQAEMTAPYLGGSSWVPTGTLKHTGNDEEGWTLLPGPPDAEILLTVNTTSGTCPPGDNRSSEVYINGIWLCIGSTPTQLWEGTATAGPHEMGPAVLRPDGTVFQAGSTGSGASAIFDTSTFQWSAGPKFPNNSHSDPLTIADGPAALLPNGNVLMMSSSLVDNAIGNPNSCTPLPLYVGAVFFELQYLTDTLMMVPAPLNAPNDKSMNGHMLVLPTGQIFFSDFSKDVEIYTPTATDGDNSWRPVVQDINNFAVANCFTGIGPYPPPPCLTIHQNLNGQTTTNTLDGLQLNGLSQGAAYGDENQSATNYPLVRITEQLSPFCLIGFNCPSPRVYYCRTHDHDNMGVATGNLLVSTKFDCPNVPIDLVGYLEVVANGIGGGGIPVRIVK